MEKENTGNTKKCPFCAEEIKAEAVKCRYCGSLLHDTEGTARRSPANYWRRVNEGKRVAGVCTGIAREFNSPKLILPLRLFFILSTFFYGFGFIFYVILWMLMPSPVDAPAGKPKRTVPPEPARGVGTRERGDVPSVLLGLTLSAAGVVLLLASLSVRHGPELPFGIHFGLPPFIQDALYFNINWITGLWPVLIFMGLLLILFGTLRLLRIVVGCGLVLAGSMFMLLFLRFLPGVLIFPGLLVIGLILVFVGGLKLLFGASGAADGDGAADRPPREM